MEWHETKRGEIPCPPPGPPGASRRKSKLPCALSARGGECRLIVTDCERGYPFHTFPEITDSDPPVHCHLSLVRWASRHPPRDPGDLGRGPQPGALMEWHETKRGEIPRPPPGPPSASRRKSKLPCAPSARGGEFRLIVTDCERGNPFHTCPEIADREPPVHCHLSLVRWASRHPPRDPGDLGRGPQPGALMEWHETKRGEIPCPPPGPPGASRRKSKLPCAPWARGGEFRLLITDGETG